MLKGGETPSHDETNPPTSPHQRALAPLFPPSFLMNSPHSFRHSRDDGKVLEELYTNDQMDFNNFLVFFWTILPIDLPCYELNHFSSVVLLLPWRFFSIAHAFSWTHLLVLFLLLSDDCFPVICCPQIFLFQCQAWDPSSDAKQEKIMTFSIWPLRGLRRCAATGKVQLSIAFTFVSPFMHSFHPWKHTSFSISAFHASKQGKTLDATFFFQCTI